ncbi:PTS system, cellobiose-specific IIB component [Bacillus sp. JCM 19046]|uniref:PTS system cellobiose-specific IIB component n=1 Tax=Shouchella xiaoxiensis TaxID=766895 RepID=A0ABS2SW76_9BACI|nr:PTS sugar transporter subunit IIB [Shouchella xiaoxiensis]MBM7839055.1 PTS system cellobiose-specific IIB component [Shouchella xiaoxiensis]GAF14178.1 PTS system, cellobiose-specific IIB component [Bacillus sp. JCM 19045]GAF19494.1 PTS system, cellobiose-specific IIB component [Bacillus sp. JCM 19046]
MNILLVCSAGMSTSMLVTKMRESAEAKGVSCQIDAVSASQLNEHLEKTNVILIGPQVRYMQAQITKQAAPHGVKVDLINQMDYGMMKGEAVLNQALKLGEG